jgi:GntR family transcriptional regulator
VIVKVRTSTSNRTPAHTKLSDILRSEIMAGKYDPKTPLPTEVALRRRFGASRFTVRQALETLVVEGLIYRRPGSGTFATSLPRQQPYVRILGSVEDAMAIGGETVFLPEHPLRRENSKAAAERLRLVEEEVFVLRGTRYLPETPFGYWQIHLPPHVSELLGEGFSGSERQSVIDKVMEVTGAQILRAEQVISAELASTRIAEALDVAIDSPVLRIERLYLDHKDDPLEWSVSKYRPDQYNYRIDLYPQAKSRVDLGNTPSAENPPS